MTFDPKEARALVERLLWLEAQYRDAGRIIAEDFKEAAASLTAALDEIERLRDENNRFRGALGDIHDGEPEWPDDHKRELAWCRERARSALKGADQ